ncbi:MAG: exodeoxyribonuclease V subunit alpha [Desulfobacterales bacterium]
MNRDILVPLQNNGTISAIDAHFGRFIAERSGTVDPDILLGIALASSVISRGDICLDLGSAAGTALIAGGEESKSLRCPELGVWVDKLAANTQVGAPGAYCPLILDDRNRLYLYRYWEYERDLAEAIKDRVQRDTADFSTAPLVDALNRLFPDGGSEDAGPQKLAALIPVLKRISVISGGPGTGKTTMVAKMLAVLIELLSPEPVSIYLAAPTGKAAAGLREAIVEAKENLNCSDAVKDLIPEETYTVHRLLGPVFGSPYFRYNRDNPLPADLLVVDEASMVDLALMSKLVQALPRDSRLILMGDKDQLASVASGSVLGDLCNRGNAAGYSEDLVRRIHETVGEGVIPDISPAKIPPGIGDCIVHLERSYRFAEGEGISRLSRAINRGESDGAMALLCDPVDQQVILRPIDSPAGLFHDLAEPIIRGYAPYLKTDDPREALMLFNRCQLICAVRKGPFGVESINHIVEQVLHRQGLIAADEPWYQGRPLLITRNHYDLKLFNGDIGILMTDPSSGSDEMYAFFPGTDEDLRRISPHRLPEHETAYAMTVHKSQGAEFETVHLILPVNDTPLLTRELIYTGMTRAKKQVTIWGSEGIVRNAISRRIDRTSGLREALWGN